MKIISLKNLIQALVNHTHMSAPAAVAAQYVFHCAALAEKLRGVVLIALQHIASLCHDFLSGKGYDQRY
ncbi:MAG: hypothetical protein K2Z81_06895 [Cyanobacteria bacterium]|nr:hypothetical protein [Cyanobacteriota bacterium]